MRYDTDIYYSTQGNPYEKASGYVVDEGTVFRIGFSCEEYGFEVKNDNGKISVIRTGEQAYTIPLTSLPSAFFINTPYGSLRYETKLLSYSCEKKTNSYTVSLSYMLTDSSGHSQKNTLKLRGMIK